MLAELYKKRALTVHDADWAAITQTHTKTTTVGRWQTDRKTEKQCIVLHVGEGGAGGTDARTAVT